MEVWSVFAQCLAPKSPPGSGREESCLLHSLRRVFVGWGLREGREPGLFHSSQPLCRGSLGQVMLPKHPRRELGSSRVKGRSGGPWPKVL